MILTPWEKKSLYTPLQRPTSIIWVHVNFWPEILKMPSEKRFSHNPYLAGRLERLGYHEEAGQILKAYQWTKQAPPLRRHSWMKPMPSLKCCSLERKIWETCKKYVLNKKPIIVTQKLWQRSFLLISAAGCRAKHGLHLWDLKKDTLNWNPCKGQSNVVPICFNSLWSCRDCGTRNCKCFRVL